MATTSTIARGRWTDSRGLHVNDIYLVSGQLAMATGDAAFAQIAEAALETRLGELPLDAEQGIPYMETAFQSSRLLPEFRASLSARLSELDFVEDVDSVETDFDRENGTVRFTAQFTTTDGGESSISGEAGSSVYGMASQEGDDGMTLVQNGDFYLPVGIGSDGVQRYRILTDYVDGEGNVQPSISESVYTRNAATGRFEEVQQ